MTNRDCRAEVRHVDSHATADEVGEKRAQLPQVLGNNMADTLARMLANSFECDEAQVLLNTHLEQPATAIRKRGHLVNLFAQQVEPAERAPRERTTQPRPKNVSKRQRLSQETTHTPSRTDNHNHCESCHASLT